MTERSVGTRGRRLFVLVALAALSTAFSAGATDLVTKTVGSCAPSYTIAKADVGRVSAQQAGHGAAIQWGLFLASRYKFGTQFKLKVYAGGVKVDAKNQTYEP